MMMMMMMVMMMMMMMMMVMMMMTVMIILHIFSYGYDVFQYSRGWVNGHRKTFANNAKQKSK